MEEENLTLDLVTHKLHSPVEEVETLRRGAVLPCQCIAGLARLL